MEKLIELLNEYERKINPYSPSNFSNYKGNLLREKQSGYYDNGVSDSYMEEVEYSDSIIISKKFGFIKWLVENDKIDFHIGSRGEKYLEYPIGSDNLDEVHDYKDIIQRLSISDTPTEDLLLYLK